MIKSTKRRARSKTQWAPPNTAVIYGRRSLERQADSLDRQDRETRPYSKKKKYVVVHEFCETASGLRETREEFQKLVEMAQQNRFRKIIVATQDRFSRFDPITFNYYIKILRDHGVEIDFVDKGIVDWSDLGQWLSGNIEQHGHHAHSVNTGKKSYSGLIAKALQGLWLTGIPYGFKSTATMDDAGKKKAGKLALGPTQEVRNVRMMFKMVLAGESLQGIARWCRDNGVRGTRGGYLDHSGVRWMLRNVAYCGDYVWGKNKGAEFVDYELYKDDLNEDGVIFIANNHPAIIDRKTFNRVQNILDKNAQRRETTPNRQGRFALSPNVLVCGFCGGPMVARRAPSGSSRRTYYRCSNHYTRGTCQAGFQLHEDVILDAIRNAISDTFCVPEHLDGIAAAMKQKLAKKAGSARNIDSEISAAEAEIAKMRRNLARCDEDDFDFVKQEIDAARQQLADLKRIKEDAGLPADAVNGFIEEAITEITSAFADLAKSLSPHNPGATRVGIQELFDPIKVYASKTRGKFTLAKLELPLRGADSHLGKMGSLIPQVIKYDPRRRVAA